MASHAQRPMWRDTLRTGARRSGAMIAAMAILALTALVALALATYHPGDPSFSTAAGGPAANALGTLGAMLADVLLGMMGWPVVLLLVLGPMAAARLWRGVQFQRWGRTVAQAVAGVVLIATALALLMPQAINTLPAGHGGVAGLAVAGGLRGLLGVAGSISVSLWGARALAAVTALGGVALYAVAIEVDWRQAPQRLRLPDLKSRRETVAEDEARPPRIDAPTRPRPVAAPEDRPGPVIAERSIAPAPPKPKAKQASLDLRDNYRLPPIDLLKKGPAKTGGAVDKAALERNARLLESVLEDFKVRGVITEVRPGPVVTMYELEPESGVKAS
ncbi:MAG: DNA translocase FtsK 4TM domain-containing protein, partial [Sphingomonas sp.]